MEAPFKSPKFCQDKQKGTTWVLGGGHTLHNMLLFANDPNRAEEPIDILNRLVVKPNGDPQPAIMLEETSHSAWVNSEAFRLAGINDSVVSVSPSLYMKNSTGQLNGIIFEDAGCSLQYRS